jgi:hypothetical protein
MGISLNGLTPAGTYPGLIKTGDNTAISGTLKTLSDGNGNDLPMAVSTTAVNFTGDVLKNGLPLATPPSGVSGAIQFSDGSAFASDAAQLFWDNTNKRLVVGTNTGVAKVHIKGAGNTSATNALYVENSDSAQLLKLTNNGVLSLGLNFPKIAGSNVIGGFSGGFNCVYNNGAYFSVAENSAATMVMDVSQNVGIGTSSPTARTHIKGSGSTSATTSLLVQNSAGTASLTVTDDTVVTIAGRLQFINAFDSIFNTSGGPIVAGGFHGFHVRRASASTQTMFEVNDQVVTSSGLLFNVKNNSFANMFAVNFLGQASMGTASPNASAQMQINSTTRGFLPPVMTTTQKNAIASPAAGLVVYDSTTNKLCCYNGSTWNDLF